jgi:acyl carrier protein
MLTNALEAEFDISIAKADFNGILTAGDVTFPGDGLS